MPALRRSALLLALAAHAASAWAGATAYTTLGLTGLADFEPPTFSGSRSQDGIATPVVPPAGAFALSANPSGVVQAGAALSLLGAVAPSPGAATVPISGAALASADVIAGQLGLAVGTQWQAVTRPGGAVSAFSAGTASAELGEGFDILLPYAGGTPAPVQVRLLLTLSGTVQDLANDATASLRATLRLSHVAEGTAGVHQQVQSFGNGTVDEVLTLDATLIDPECSTAAGLCGYFFSAYAALESVGQVPIGSGLYDVVAAGDRIDFEHGASLRLLLPAGATATAITSGQALAWVSAVPEPGTGLLGAAGLAVLAASARRRAVRA